MATVATTAKPSATEVADVEMVVVGESPPAAAAVTADAKVGEGEERGNE